MNLGVKTDRQTGEIVLSVVNAEEVHVDVSGYVLLNESLLLYLVTTCCPVVPVTYCLILWVAGTSE